MGSGGYIARPLAPLFKQGNIEDRPLQRGGLLTPESRAKEGQAGLGENGDHLQQPTDCRHYR